MIGLGGEGRGRGRGSSAGRAPAGGGEGGQAASDPDSAARRSRASTHPKTLETEAPVLLVNASVTKAQVMGDQRASTERGGKQGRLGQRARSFRGDSEGRTGDALIWGQLTLVLSVPPCGGW